MNISLKRNFIYNALYQILTLILPFITTPYISRIIGAEGIGVYSYAFSIVSYFGLFIMLGLSNYGNRTIAAVRDDKYKLSKSFLSIYAMQLLMSLIIILTYILYVLFIADNKFMAWIQIIYLVATAININWLFFGLEQFKTTVSRDTIIKILSLVAIFTFVKTKDDIYLYAVIMLGGQLLSQIYLWLVARKHIVRCSINSKDVIKHIKPNLILFIPVIAISLYTLMGKIMLGTMSDMKEVGYYENASKLTTIPSMAITALGTVMLPRMSNLIAKGNSKKAMQYIQKSLIVSVLISSSIAMGMSGVIKEFVPIFYGAGFEKCGDIIRILIVSSVFMSWANVIRTQYLIPMKKDQLYIKSVFLGAIVNIVINLVLIPKYASLGAAVGTLCAEISVCLYQTYQVRKQINIKLYFKQSIPLLLSAVAMYIIVMNIPFITSNLITLLIKVCVGGVIYFVLFSLYYFRKLKYILK